MGCDGGGGEQLGKPAVEVVMEPGGSGDGAQCCLLQQGQSWGAQPATGCWL